jgi:hypothetical protein
MRRDEYRDGQNSGFRIAGTRKELIEGTFVQRFELNDEVQDPFGRTVSYPRVEFRIAQFALSTTTPELQLINPSRSTRALVTRLAELVSFSSAIAALEVDVLAWLNHVEARMGPAVVKKLRATNIAVPPDSTAAIEIEGPVDVRRRLRDVVGRRKLVVEHVVAVLAAPEGSYEVRLGRDASATIPQAIMATAVPELRMSLMASRAET